MHCYLVQIFILGEKKEVEFDNFKQADIYAKEVWTSYQNLSEEEKRIIFIDIKKAYKQKDINSQNNIEQYTIVKTELRKTYRY